MIGSGFAVAIILFFQANILIAESQVEVATFAGGCFWCTESDFDKVAGVIKTISGYTGGEEINPTYEEVSSGKTGHIEAVQVTFDASLVSFEKLLEVYWKSIDPSVENRQFCDEGPQYRSAIFYHNRKQQALVWASKQALIEKRMFENIFTEIHAATDFYPAEDYHQDYYLKNPARYQFYRWRCGRDERLKTIWDK